MTKGVIVPLESARLIDLSEQTHRQVIVDREPGQYLGHRTERHGTPGSGLEDHGCRSA